MDHQENFRDILIYSNIIIILIIILLNKDLQKT